MPDWTTCAHCKLRHRERPEGLCPRCKEPLAGEVARAASTAPDVSGRPLSGLSFAGAGQSLAVAGALPDVYDGRELPRSRLEREGADSDPADSPWLALAGGAFMLWGAYHLHGAFAELASGQRESVRVWWGIALMYRMLGPSITVAVVGLVGAAMTWTGMRRLAI